MIMCDVHLWWRARQLWYRFVYRIRRRTRTRSYSARSYREPRRFEKAELIEKYGFNRHL